MSISFLFSLLPGLTQSIIIRKFSCFSVSWAPKFFADLRYHNSDIYSSIILQADMYLKILLVDAFLALLCTRCSCSTRETNANSLHPSFWFEQYWTDKVLILILFSHIFSFLHGRVVSFNNFLFGSASPYSYCAFSTFASNALWTWCTRKVELQHISRIYKIIAKKLNKKMGRKMFRSSHVCAYQKMGKKSFPHCKDTTMRIREQKGVKWWTTMP